MRMLIGSSAAYVGLGHMEDLDMICDIETALYTMKLMEYPYCRPSKGGNAFVLKTRTDNPTMKGRKLISPVEIDIAWSGSSNKELVDLVIEHHYYKVSTITSIGPNDIEFIVPHIDVLYALKMSHRFKKDSPHFLKTMRDIKTLRQAGAKIPTWLYNWFKRREAETYNYSHPNLSVSKKDFFQDPVPYIYDHDSIHEVMAHNAGQPIYTMFKRDGAEVAVDRKKWEDLPMKAKLQCVAEEAYVLALERSQIPHGKNCSPWWSFQTAMMKLCTSISSGWWREFAWEHYEEVSDTLYDPNYVTKFWAAEKAGKVRPFKR